MLSELCSRCCLRLHISLVINNNNYRKFRCVPVHEIGTAASAAVGVIASSPAGIHVLWLTPRCRGGSLTCMRRRRSSVLCVLWAGSSWPVPALFSLFVLLAVYTAVPAAPSVPILVLAKEIVRAHPMPSTPVTVFISMPAIPPAWTSSRVASVSSVTVRRPRTRTAACATWRRGAGPGSSIRVGILVVLWDQVHS